MHPDKVFSAYYNLIPLLPNKVSVWVLNLVTQFFDSLSPDCQNALHINSIYSSPGVLTIVTRSLPLKSLRHLCVADFRQHTLSSNQLNIIVKTVNYKLKYGSSTALAALVSVYPPPIPHPFSPVAPFFVASPDNVSDLTRLFMSPAKQTMQRYQPSPVSNPTNFRIDPVTNFQNTHPQGF